MDLPIKLFFALHSQGVRIEAKQYREHLRIAAVPKMDLKYFDILDEFYRSISDPSSKPKMPERAPSPCIEMGTLEARHILQSVMTNVKRNMGYGR